MQRRDLGRLRSNGSGSGGVIGWTSALAAYGPFLFSLALGAVIAAAFYALCAGVN